MLGEKGSSHRVDEQPPVAVEESGHVPHKSHGRPLVHAVPGTNGAMRASGRGCGKEGLTVA